MIRTECVCFQSGFISIVLNMQSHEYTAIHLETLITQCFIPSCYSWPSFPSQWNPFCYWQTPVNLPLSHTRIPSPLSWQSCCFSALLLATPAAVLIFMVVIFSFLSFMETMSEILEGWILSSISARCVCVLTRLLVRRSSAYLSANNLCLQTHMCGYTYTVYFTHTYAVYLKIKLIFTQLKLFSRIIIIGCVADCVLNDSSHFKTKAAQFI